MQSRRRLRFAGVRGRERYRLDSDERKNSIRMLISLYDSQVYLTQIFTGWVVSRAGPSYFTELLLAYSNMNNELCTLVRYFIHVILEPSPKPFLVDDGTGTIECTLRHVSPQALNASSSGKPEFSASSKYHPRSKVTSGKAKIPVSSSTGLPQTPKPFASVGDIVRVEGRVLNRRYTRLVNVDKLSSLVFCLADDFAY
jgi:hypothetical protein